MRIIHPLDEFFYTLFPEITNQSQIVPVLTQFYKFEQYTPSVTLENGFVYIDVDIQSIVKQESDFQKVIKFCEAGKYSEAKPILTDLISNNPTNSEYHRILGQVYSDEGDIEGAINSLIDALRWDGKNAYALIMMGNIFAREKDDLNTAQTYYDQALVAKPDDNITINNIGANLMQQGKIAEAKKYFDKALGIDNKYPNTHYALAMIAASENDMHSAIYSFIQTIKYSKKNDSMYKLASRDAFDIAKKLIAIDDKSIFRKFRSTLEKMGNVDIDIVTDETIPTVAKIEYAENYNRAKHIVKYKASAPAYIHLVMHELCHLLFSIDAKKAGQNKLFINNSEHKEKFIRNISLTLKKLSKMGVAEASVQKYASELFEGLNRQIFNAPVDLLIEEYLFNEFPQLRPYQFISNYTIIQESLVAVTDKKVVEHSPKDVLSKSKIYNLTNAMLFKDLYGIDLITDFQASKLELDMASSMYNEFKEYKDDKEPAEEYELVQHWAEDLSVDMYFELVDENEYRQSADFESQIASISDDPFNLNNSDPKREEEMKTFLESHNTQGLNMAVAMFMLDALQYFKDMSPEAIKKIAFEIAMQGTQGYNPSGESYKLSSIPNKTFSGYHIIAYYYVSFKLVLPELVKELQLPFDDEYILAQQLFKTK